MNSILGYSHILEEKILEAVSTVLRENVDLLDKSLMDQAVVEFSKKVSSDCDDNTGDCIENWFDFSFPFLYGAESDIAIPDGPLDIVGCLYFGSAHGDIWIRRETNLKEEVVGYISEVGGGICEEIDIKALLIFASSLKALAEEIELLVHKDRKMKKGS